MIGDNASSTIEKQNLLTDTTDIRLIRVLDKDTNELLFDGFETNNAAIAQDIENIILAEGVPVLRKVWQSRYNSYVAYDYEPFGIEGYHIRLLVSPNDVRVAWAQHLLERRYERIEKLEAALVNA